MSLLLSSASSQPYSVPSSASFHHLEEYSELSDIIKQRDLTNYSDIISLFFFFCSTIFFFLLFQTNRECFWCSCNTCQFEPWNLRAWLGASLHEDVYSVIFACSCRQWCQRLVKRKPPCNFDFNWIFNHCYVIFRYINIVMSLWMDEWSGDPKRWRCLKHVLVKTKNNQCEKSKRKENCLHINLVQDTSNLIVVL